MLRAGRLRHYVNVMTPATGTGTRGQRSGSDVQLLGSVPAEVVTLSGRELESARQKYAEASIRVRLYADPSNPITTDNYLQFGARRLQIGYVNDVDQVGVELELLCSEAAA